MMTGLSQGSSTTLIDSFWIIIRHMLIFDSLTIRDEKCRDKDKKHENSLRQWNHLLSNKSVSIRQLWTQRLLHESQKVSLLSEASQIASLYLHVKSWARAIASKSLPCWVFSICRRTEHERLRVKAISGYLWESDSSWGPHLHEMKFTVRSHIPKLAAFSNRLKTRSWNFASCLLTLRQFSLAAAVSHQSFLEFVFKRRPRMGLFLLLPHH